MRFPVLALVALGMATVATAQTTAPWDYTGKRGTLEWGKLDPAYKACSAGHEHNVQCGEHRECQFADCRVSNFRYCLDCRKHIRCKPGSIWS